MLQVTVGMMGRQCEKSYPRDFIAGSLRQTGWWPAGWP
jgi:hypothetical protein